MKNFILLKSKLAQQVSLTLLWLLLVLLFIPANAPIPLSRDLKVIPAFALVIGIIWIWFIDWGDSKKELEKK